MKTVLIIVGGLALLVAVGLFLLYWFVLKPDHTTETLLDTEYRGLRIRFQRDFYKAKIGSNSESVMLYLNGKEAAETGTVWKGWGNPDARPLPIHRDDLARIVATRTFFSDSLYDDKKYRNLWIRPERFSPEQFDKIADFIQQHQGIADPPFGTLTKNFPYFIANVVYGDPDPMQSRIYTRNGDESSGSVEVRMDGEVDYSQWPYTASIGQVLKGGETLRFAWNRNGSWAGSDTARLTVADLVHFRDNQGKGLTERYRVRPE